MKHALPFLGLSLFLCFIPSSANAQQSVVYQCGIPVAGDIDIEPNMNFCDIYARQLAYKDSADTLRDQLEARQKNFAAPRIESYNRYQKELDALHSSISSK